MAGDEAAVVVSGRRDTPNKVDDLLHLHLLSDVEDVKEEAGFLDAIEAVDEQILVMRLSRRNCIEMEEDRSAH